MTRWNEHEDAIDDVISDSIDMDWTPRTGAKAVVAWLNENAAAPAPSSLAGGEVTEAVARTEDRIGSRLMKAKDEAWNLVPQGQRAKWIEDNLASATVEVSYSDIRAILAALSPEAPARPVWMGIDAAGDAPQEFKDFAADFNRRQAALTSRHEAPTYADELANESLRRRDAEFGRHEAPAEGAGETIEARFPELNDDLIRMASTENTGSLTEWGRFVERLQSALRARSSAPEARKGEAVAWRYRYPNDTAWQLTQDHDQAFKNTGEVEPLGVIPFGAAPSADKLRIVRDWVEGSAHHDDCTWMARNGLVSASCDCGLIQALAVLKAEGGA